MRQALLILLLSGVCLAQAGTPTTNGDWFLLNECSDINSSDLGTYAPSQVNFADHNATITMTRSVGGFPCGYSNPTNHSSTQDYKTGSIMLHDLNIAPTGTPSATLLVPSSGTVTIEAQWQSGRGWDSIWMLGGSKALNTGCQNTSPRSWDNFETCNWSLDSSDSAEIDLFEQFEGTGYTQVESHLFNTNSHTCAGWSGVTNTTTNFHTIHLDWSTSAINFKLDGVSGGSCTTDIPTHPMFIIIENRVHSGQLPPSGVFPTVMTIKYVQVCDGATCTAPDSAGGNTMKYWNFAAAAPTPPAPSTPGTMFAEVERHYDRSVK